jgi:hypothetical protein
MKGKLLPALLILLLFPSLVSAQEDHYICTMETCGISGDGSSWSSPLAELPVTLQRGHTYYVADGSYGSYTFDDPEQGEEYIYIKKAIESDHGMDTGWSSAYGDGQAVFADSIAFNSGY